MFGPEGQLSVVDASQVGSSSQTGHPPPLFFFYIKNCLFGQKVRPLRLYQSEDEMLFFPPFSCESPDAHFGTNPFASVMLGTGRAHTHTCMCTCITPTHTQRGAEATKEHRSICPSSSSSYAEHISTCVRPASASLLCVCVFVLL